MPEDKIEYIYDKYVDWKAKPIINRKEDPSYPQDVEDFMALHGIDKFTLADFAERPGHYELISQRAILWARGRIPEILHSVYADARKLKDPIAAERFFNLIIELNKSQNRADSNPAINNYNFFGDIDDEKYKRIVQREAKRVSADQGSEVKAD